MIEKTFEYAVLLGMCRWIVVEVRQREVFFGMITDPEVSVYFLSLK